jgi:hypothetical protein
MVRRESHPGRQHLAGSGDHRQPVGQQVDHPRRIDHRLIRQQYGGAERQQQPRFAPPQQGHQRHQRDYGRVGQEQLMDRVLDHGRVGLYRRHGGEAVAVGLRLPQHGRQHQQGRAGAAGQERPACAECCSPVAGQRCRRPRCGRQAPVAGKARSYNLNKVMHLDDHERHQHQCGRPQKWRYRDESAGRNQMGKSPTVGSRLVGSAPQQPAAREHGGDRAAVDARRAPGFGIHRVEQKCSRQEERRPQRRAAGA